MILFSTVVDVDTALKLATICVDNDFDFSVLALEDKKED